MYKAEFLRGTIHPNFSKGETDKVLVSMILTYPLCIHGEVMTYRRFARNSASLRAIPTAKIIEMVEANPFIPEFTKNQKGMAANYWITGENREKAEAYWRRALRDAIAHAKYLAELGVAKQDVNRLLAPFMWNTIIATAPLTDWLHLLNQRLHKDADPKFQRLAQEIRTALNEGKYFWVQSQYHLPFGGTFGKEIDIVNNIAQIARVSYLNRGEFTHEQNKARYDKLIQSGHWSPFDHIAQTSQINYNNMIWKYWITLRDDIPNWYEYKQGGIIQHAKDNGITIDLI